MAISTYLPVITLNGNGLNSLIRRHRMTEWIKHKTYLYIVYKGLTLNIRAHKTESEGMKKDTNKSKES